MQEIAGSVEITLNGDPFEVAGPLTVSALLSQLDIDSRRVAVEHNLVVLKRALYESTMLNEGDEVEIVNFVGGGAPAAVARRWKEARRRPRRRATASGGGAPRALISARKGRGGR